VPLSWGAWTWLTAARDELRAAVQHETAALRATPAGAGDPVVGTVAAPRDAADSARDFT